MDANYFSNITAYPQGSLNRSGYFMTMFDTTTTLYLYNKPYINCKNNKNTLCYTQSKGTSIYIPHSNYGMVGTTASGYLARRRRI